MMSCIKKIALALGAALMLASCGVDDGPVDFKPLSFVRYQPIYLNVSTIEFENDYKSPMKPPYVEHLMPYSPEDAMHIWVRDRIRAVGPEKSLRIIIKDASVIATELHKDNSLEDFFTVDQDRRYDAKLEVELRIYGIQSPIYEASVTVKAARSITLSENASVYRRNAAFRKLVADLMESVNAELEKNMYQYMGNYINYSQNP